MLSQNTTKQTGPKRRPRVPKSYRSKSSFPLERLPAPSKSCRPPIQKNTAQIELQIVQNILDLVQKYSQEASSQTKESEASLPQPNTVPTIKKRTPSSDSRLVKVQVVQETDEPQPQLESKSHSLQAIQIPPKSVQESTHSIHSCPVVSMKTRYTNHRLTDADEVDYGEMTVDEIRAYEKTHVKYMDPDVKAQYKQSEKEFRKNLVKVWPLGCDACRRQRSLCYRCDMLKSQDDRARKNGENIVPRGIWTSDQIKPHGVRLSNTDESEPREDEKLDENIPSTETFERTHKLSIIDRLSKKQPQPPRRPTEPRPIKAPSENLTSVARSEMSERSLITESLVGPPLFPVNESEVSCSALPLNQFHRLKDYATAARNRDFPEGHKVMCNTNEGVSAVASRKRSPVTPPCSSPTSSGDSMKRISRKQNSIAKRYCWNCWHEHPSVTCPDPRRTVSEAERLRQECGIEAPPKWKERVSRSENLVEQKVRSERHLDSSYKGEIEICWNCWKSVHNRKLCPERNREPQEREDRRRTRGAQPTIHYTAWQKSHGVSVAGPGTSEWEPLSKCWQCRQYGHLPEECDKFEPVASETVLPPPEAWEIPENMELVNDTWEQKADVSEPEGTNTLSDGSTYSTDYDENISETSDTAFERNRRLDGVCHPLFGDRIDYIRMMPTEILDEIFSYLPATSLIRLPDCHRENYIRTGALELSITEWNTRHVRKTCTDFHNIVQRHIYSTVHIQSLKSFEGFVRSIVNFPELGSFVKDVRVDIQQSFNVFKSLQVIPVQRSSTLGRNMAPTLLKMLEACPNLHTLSAMSWGAIEIMDMLDDHYPNIKRLSLKDDNDVSKSHKLIWRNLQRCPNIEEFSVTHTENNMACDFEEMRIHPSLYVSHMQYQYRHLRCLKFTRSAEISDDNLAHLVTHMKGLRTLELTNCKLITSSGLANALYEMKPNQLHHLCFILYRDSYNKPTELEEGTRSNFHLCQSIRDNCMQKLKSLYYSPHRVCGCLFQDSVWPNLQKVVFDTMDFVGCKKTSNGNRTKVLDSFDSARMPRLRWPAQFQLGIPHIHFQRAVLHVDESDADHQDI